MENLSKNKIFGFVGVVVLTITLTACSINRSTTVAQRPHKVRRISDRRLIQETRNQYFPYHYLQLKFSAKYRQGTAKYSLKGFLRTTRDSIIWLSLYHKTGIPVARMAFTKDSVTFLNQLEKQYVQYAYTTLQEKYGYSLNYSIIQGFLFDEFFLYGDKELSTRNLRKAMKLYVDSNTYVFQSMRERKLKHYAKRNKKNKFFILQLFKINPETKKIVSAQLTDTKQNFHITIEYNNFEKKDSVMFPMKQHIVATTKTDTIDLELKLKKIKIKQAPLNYTIKKPKSKE